MWNRHVQWDVEFYFSRLTEFRLQKISFWPSRSKNNTKFYFREEIYARPFANYHSVIFVRIRKFPCIFLYSGISVCIRQCLWPKRKRWRSRNYFKIVDENGRKHETETCRDKYSCWNMIIYRNPVKWLRIVNMSFRKTNTEVIPMCFCLRFRFVSLTAQCSQWEFAAGWLHKKNISAMLFRNEGGG